MSQKNAKEPTSSSEPDSDARLAVDRALERVVTARKAGEHQAVQPV